MKPGIQGWIDWRLAWTKRHSGVALLDHAQLPQDSWPPTPRQQARNIRGGEIRWETFLYELKAGPAGGRLRWPSSRRQ
jgi:hypothetical protein